MARQTRADKDIVAKAHRDFNEAVSWERTARSLFSDDMKFLFGDSDNHDQWNAQVRAQRITEGLPMITINKTHTHWLHVVNQIKVNRPGIHVHPVGGQASYDAAQVFEAVIRHIEYASDAQQAYGTAAENQVGGGIGYWRICTEYTDDNGFDQEIFIKPIQDPLTVYMPCKRKDGADARFCLIYDDWAKEKFKAKYPNANIGDLDRDLQSSGWVTDNTVRVAEYYVVENSKEWMYAIPNEEGGFDYRRESSMSPEEKELFRAMLDEELDEQPVMRRKVDRRQIKWYLIAGDQVIDRADWAGSHIPVIRVVGEELVLDGKLDRKGLVRYMKDAQRMYNYNTTASVEFGALQGKSPYTAPIEAIEGHEEYWKTANTVNHSILPYNAFDENNNPIPKPERQAPPQAAPAYLEGMKSASLEMMMASGQYDATFGSKAQELSGVALENRQEQGERATYHFVDAMAQAIRYTGKQLVDLIPRIYDTKRVIRILDEDGTEDQITIDPEQQVPLQQQKDEKEKVLRSIFNPNAGKYDVVAKTGPSYDTRRQEAAEAMKDLITGVPALAQVIGDMYVGQTDFPGSDKIAERIRNWIPAAIRGDGPSQEVQQLQQQLEQVTQIAQQLEQQLNDKSTAERIAKQQVDTEALNMLAKRIDEDRRAAADEYRAFTERISKLLPFVTPAPEGAGAVAEQALGDAAAQPPINQEPDAAQAIATGLLATDLGQPIN
jgi:hypothetical protein